MKLPENMQQLIRQKEEHKRLEDDRLQSKRKAPAALQYYREYQTTSSQQRPRREVGRQDPVSWAKGVNVTFKVLVHKFLEKIKHESYFH